MPSDQHNLKGYKSLFDSILHYVQCVLHGLTSALLYVPTTVKSVNSVVAHDGFLFAMEIFRLFHTDYLDYTVAFQGFVLFGNGLNTTGNDL